MINLNKEILVKNCEITNIDNIGWITVETPDGQTFEGKQKYGKQKNFKVGERVNIRLSYSVTGECYLFWQVTRTRKPKLIKKPTGLTSVDSGVFYTFERRSYWDTCVTKRLDQMLGLSADRSLDKLKQRSGKGMY